MLWPSKRVEEITEADIRELVASQQVELRTVEYKEALPGKLPSERKEFLADVSSFANARGGQLFYGIPAVEGIPQEPIGLTDQNVDHEKQRLENMIRDGVHPRIFGVGIHGVELSDGGVVYVIRIPRSFARPHQVDYRFYSRNSVGKYPISVDELRTLITLSAESAERLRAFRMERLGVIVADDIPVVLMDGPRLVLHVLPLGALDTSTIIDPAGFRGDPDNRPIFGQSNEVRFNLDGYLTWALASQDGQARGYFQGFRSGFIEAVDAYTFGAVSSEYVLPLEVEITLVAAVMRYARLLAKLGVELPFGVAVSVLGVGGRYFMVPRHLQLTVTGQTLGSHLIDRDDLHLPDIVLEQLPEDTQDFAQMMRPIFDAFWQAAGWPRSFGFDAGGNYTELAQVERRLAQR